MHVRSIVRKRKHAAADLYRATASRRYKNGGRNAWLPTQSRRCRALPRAPRVCPLVVTKRAFVVSPAIPAPRIGRAQAIADECRRAYAALIVLRMRDENCARLTLITNRERSREWRAPFYPLLIYPFVCPFRSLEKFERLHSSRMLIVSRCLLILIFVNIRASLADNNIATCGVIYLNKQTETWSSSFPAREETMK